MAQRRADASADPALRAAAYALVWGARTGTPARLHVSGDFLCPSGLVDRAYVRGLVIIGRWLSEAYGARTHAWSYTHIPRDVFEPYRLELSRAGIAVRYSDDPGHNAAVVARFQDRLFFERLRRQGRRYAKCLAQTASKTCRDCKVCWERPDLLVVFDPEGQWAKSLTPVALAALAALEHAPAAPRPSLRVVA